jgi:hypothetical protein
MYVMALFNSGGGGGSGCAAVREQASRKRDIALRHLLEVGLGHMYLVIKY